MTEHVGKAVTALAGVGGALALVAAVMVGSGWLAPASKVDAVETRLEARTTEIRKLEVSVSVMAERVENLRTEQTQLRAEQRAGFDRLAAKLDKIKR